MYIVSRHVIALCTDDLQVYLQRGDDCIARENTMWQRVFSTLPRLRSTCCAARWVPRTLSAICCAHVRRAGWRRPALASFPTSCSSGGCVDGGGDPGKGWNNDDRACAADVDQRGGGSQTKDRGHKGVDVGGTEGGATGVAEGASSHTTAARWRGARR